MGVESFRDSRGTLRGHGSFPIAACPLPGQVPWPKGYRVGIAQTFPQRVMRITKGQHCRQSGNDRALPYTLHIAGRSLGVYCMGNPHLTVLGVYRPTVSQEAWQEQWQVTGSDDHTKEHFDSLVLIEAVVDGLDEPFDMSQFGQMQADHPNDPRYMQVGYDEALLSADGETVIQREMNCVRGTGKLRFAVYLHFCDPSHPIRWQGGEVNCPPIQDAPMRLMRLMPYNACT